MKKALIFAGLAAATLSFVGCNKEADIAVKDAKPFQVVLNTSETRTAIDPDNTLMTVWAEGDQINVFHAEAGTTDYKHDTPYADNTGHPYTISDVGNGVFSGTLMGGDLEEGKSYDWYFYYPYNTYLKSPACTSAAVLTSPRRSKATTAAFIWPAVPPRPASRYTVSRRTSPPAPSRPRS